LQSQEFLERLFGYLAYTFLSIQAWVAAMTFNKASLRAKQETEQTAVSVKFERN
jgi:hypothetical protein